MKFEIVFERTYPHAIGKVWAALTDRVALATWLMDTDFVPEVGRAFRMSCDDGEGGTDVYACRVLELEPQSLMVWSWVLEGRQSEGETIVEFRLEEIPDGTRLIVKHSGDRDPGIVEQFQSGWPVKLDQLADALQTSRR